MERTSGYGNWQVQGDGSVIGERSEGRACWYALVEPGGAVFHAYNQRRRWTPLATPGADCLRAEAWAAARRTAPANRTTDALTRLGGAP